MLGLVLGLGALLAPVLPAVAGGLLDGNVHALALLVLAAEEAGEEGGRLLLPGGLFPFLGLAPGVAEGTVFIGDGVILPAVGALDRLAPKSHLLRFHRTAFLLASLPVRYGALIEGSNVPPGLDRSSKAPYDTIRERIVIVCNLS